MSLSLYEPGTTPLHRLRPGAKLGALFVVGVVVFLVSDLRILAAAVATAAVLLLSARVRPKVLARRLSGVAVMLAVLFAATGLLQGWDTALTALLRLVTLILTAFAVTLTTRPAALLELFEWLISPLARLGVANPERISLSVSLVLRFVPELSRRYHEIREAQAARGLHANPVALLVPLIVRTLKSADDVADAIDARCYPPPRRSPGGRA
ncbi:biotin transport system permease protein [Streptosporangium becharense]|uniref:Biotin transport system permease protein n=1 Tax=Streptosporangium becharense TaxID=1816182 RepID=A0A7W9IBC3_9ACTN|nr:energy-coupling factor transporter transmembrane component T [Streptosporangium becharense]MBB2910720.1 biotin transport system permease protein [Streptosporangium becharense]MBB5817415.1 biotin transport system permease protein [Streptosporangium becharense]